MEKFVDYEMCKQCGGACCKQCGCIYMPQDFKSMDFAYLRSLLDEGNISISGQPFPFSDSGAWSFLLYLRARNQNSEIVDLIANGEPCKLLTDAGCSLDESERPTLGLLVKPTVIGGPCELMCKTEKAMGWLDYSEVLSRLVEYYTDKDVISVVVEQITTRMNSINEKIAALHELKAVEKAIGAWYYNIMANKPYYTPEEVKKMKLF